MQPEFKVGAAARKRGCPEVGTVTAVEDGYVAVEYHHSADRVTSGYYPIDQVDLVEPPTSEKSAPSSKKRVVFAFDEGGETPRPRASSKDILS